MRVMYDGERLVKQQVGAAAPPQATMLYDTLSRGTSILSSLLLLAASGCRVAAVQRGTAGQLTVVQAQRRAQRITQGSFLRRTWTPVLLMQVIWLSAVVHGPRKVLGRCGSSMTKTV